MYYLYSNCIKLIVLSASVLTLLSFIILNILPRVTPPDKSYAGLAPYMFEAFAHAFYSAAFWAAIPYLAIVADFIRYSIDEKLLGFTLGLMISMQNANSALVTVLVGLIRDNTQNYRKGYLFVCFFMLLRNYTLI